MDSARQIETVRRLILDNPDDNAARLIYADMLTDTWKPWNVARADLIRLQVGRLGAGEIAIAESVAKENAILKKWGARWLPSWGRQARGSCASFGVRGEVVRVDTFRGSDFTVTEAEYTFERGFASRVRVSGRGRPHSSACAEFARSCLAAHPVESITLVRRDHGQEISFAFYRTEYSWWVDGPGSVVREYEYRRELLADLPSVVAEVFGSVRLAEVFGSVRFDLVEIPH